MFKEVFVVLAAALCLAEVSGLAVVTSGPFHTVKGLAFVKSSAYRTEEVTMKCKCSKACAQSATCLMFGGYLAQDTYYCSLYSSTPYQMGVRPLPYNNSFLSVKVVADGAVYDGRDGYMYWLGTTLMDLTQARDECNKKSSYRLGIYKQDVQVQILQHFYALSGGTDSIMISLTKDPNTGKAVWGDGTPYVASGAYSSLILDDGGASSTVYAYGLNGKINDVPPTYHGYVLCQGAPFLTPIL